nr:hypothetical protein [uncultured Duganella sp.]
MAAKTDEIQVQMTTTLEELQALSSQTKISWAELEAPQERVEEESKELGTLMEKVSMMNYEARRERGDFY